MEETEFARPAGELSCIIGNLFSGLEPPCDFGCTPALVICGTTHSGKYGRLTVQSDRCIFYGDPEDLAAVLKGNCPERRCIDGR